MSGRQLEEVIIPISASGKRHAAVVNHHVFLEGLLVSGIHAVVESAPPRASGDVTKVLVPEGPDYHHRGSRSSSSCDESTRVYPRGGSACTPMYRRALHSGGRGSHSLLLLVLGDISILLYTV